jgi:hypothetical protein
VLDLVQYSYILSSLYVMGLGSVRQNIFMLVHISVVLTLSTYSKSQFQRPRDLRRRSAAASLLGLWVRIPPSQSVVIVVCCQVEVSAMS